MHIEDCPDDTEGCRDFHSKCSALDFAHNVQKVSDSEILNLQDWMFAAPSFLKSFNLTS